MCCLGWAAVSPPWVLLVLLLLLLRTLHNTKSFSTLCRFCLFLLFVGLEALVKSDKRFTPFTESLFSRSSLNASREQLTAEENDALNANLAAFLRVLTNHFLAAAAFQVLEYCIRRYK